MIYKVTVALGWRRERHGRALHLWLNAPHAGSVLQREASCNEGSLAFFVAVGIQDPHLKTRFGRGHGCDLVFLRLSDFPIAAHLTFCHLGLLYR